jgi:methylase of polypeptide subunit release factors
LAEWCLENKHRLKEKHVLELGSGSGFTGLAIAATCQLESMTLTDGHEKVLKQLNENLRLNFSTNCDGMFVANKTKISVEKLDWEEVEAEHLPFGPNLILAAGNPMDFNLWVILISVFQM